MNRKLQPYQKQFQRKYIYLVSSQLEIQKKTLLKDDSNEFKIYFQQYVSELLKQFFNQTYFSNLISLLIESILSISELKMYIKNFQKFKNNNLIQPFYVKILVILFSMALN
ncbi:unnamed protein product [Paramecium pentaurelia]|uniref:Transmembrane protein n=1 Tax=Paramecium pentaurelia TaxID=43138 RepID=A0A8S1XVB0_9CILI|nr:unnamed protein product [Paramecium pentaurelia]